MVQCRYNIVIVLSTLKQYHDYIVTTYFDDLRKQLGRFRKVREKKKRITLNGYSGTKLSKFLNLKHKSRIKFLLIVV